MQTARARGKTTLRVVAGGPSRRTPPGLGARTRFDGRVSKVDGDAAESGVDREISGVEIFGWRDIERITGKGRRRIFGS